MNPLSGNDPQSVGAGSAPRPGQLSSSHELEEVRLDTVKSPASVMVISVIEIALGLLAIGLVLASQASSFNPAPVYLSIYAYASALFLATALALLAAALLSSPLTRLQRTTRATIYVAAAAFVLTAGYSILAQVYTWTTPITCDGCSTLSSAPTVNQIVASVVLDIGGGALSALLPVVVLVLLRNRREAGAPGPNDTLTPPPAPATSVVGR
jgi:hypothetical protein